MAMPKRTKVIVKRQLTAKVIEDSDVPADTIESAVNLQDLENVAWELQDLIMQICDEVESGEPLQAKQTYENILVRIQSIGEYVNAPDVE